MIAFDELTYLHGKPLSQGLLKANPEDFVVVEDLGFAPDGEGEHVLRLITLRSHDQYNTTIYALDDRYRGVFGRRDVLFMNEGDMAQLGLEHGDRVDIETALPGKHQRLNDITLVAYNIASGTVGAYYPEANVLVPLLVDLI